MPNSSTCSFAGCHNPKVSADLVPTLPLSAIVRSLEHPNSYMVNVAIEENGKLVARRNIIADGALREVSFDVPIAQGSWVVLRILPSSHTNPVFVTINN